MTRKISLLGTIKSHNTFLSPSGATGGWTSSSFAAPTGPALAFASAEELQAYLRLTPGSVTPLGLLQDTAHQVQSFLDADFLTPLGRIGIHSNDNTAAAWLQAEALLGLLRDFGTPVVVANFSAPAAE